MTYNSHPFQLLEINVVSAQDLSTVSKSMRTYAIIWVHPDRKLSTKVDQIGHINPQWNEKFVFRVDDTFLNAETSVITVEIYAAAWLRDVRIGSVRVLISSLFPATYTNDTTKMRLVALQIRRSSGRPQGILNMGIQLLNSAMRSMPMYTELSASNITDTNDIANAHAAKLRRTRSDQTDHINNGGSLINYSPMAKPKEKQKDGVANGSMVNGSLCSDVGPSASVVAAAIAKGLMRTPGGVAPKKIIDVSGGAGSSIVEEWTEIDSVEGLKTKLERWRTEVPPIHETVGRNKIRSGGRKKKRRPRERSHGGGLFSCFGNAFGCEISITCGGDNSKKRYDKVCDRLSSVDDASSYL